MKVDAIGAQTGLERGRRKPWYGHLYLQVVMGFVLGAAVGYFYPASAGWFEPLATGFVKLIRMALAPIIFGTVVVGISQMGSLKDVGRIGLKSILYFEVVTTLALVIGLVVVNVFQPGAGFNADPASLDPRAADSYVARGKEQAAGGVAAFFMNIIPTSVVGAFAEGNMLQVIFFSVLLGVALAQLPGRGKVVIDALEVMNGALFGVVRLIMYLAPLAAFGAMAFTVGKYGVGTLVMYAKVVACLYLTSILFVFLVLGAVAWLNGISLWRFLVYIRDEILITFATASSESVFPRMLEKMERLGCRKSVVGLVLPAGYTFNADGSCIYMTMGAMFLAQATNTHLSIGDQLVILAVCLITSKGSAGVSGAGFIALAATLASMQKIPVASLVLLLGIDRFLSEARAVTNMIGNGIATVAVARWEKGFDVDRARAVLAGNQVVELNHTEMAVGREGEMKEAERASTSNE